MRLLIATIAIAALFAVACADEKRPAPAAPTGGPAADELPATPVEPEPKADEPVVEPTADEPAAEPKADDPAAKPKADDPAAKPKADDCVADCIQRNQMRAVAAEQIERDCKAECSK
jgi:hypothetical protein